MELEAELNERFSQFYWEEIGPYWPPERKLVDAGYAGIDFPFVEAAPPNMAMEKKWDLDELLGYISTWSAVRSVSERGDDHLLSKFASDIERLWGDATRKRLVRWPINMRLGTV